ncbi:hypothetical protein GGD38_007361 [Chitinophagaceae bacterium OAS944]|nr:hypothetical protein [Chitinophagaceae bacterium OAS944]
MFEFEATTYEIIRYVYIKGDRPVKCVDEASICWPERSVTTLWDVRSMFLFTLIFH